MLLNNFFKKKKFIFSDKINNLNLIYKIICKHISASIFPKLGFFFFKNVIKKKIIKCYYLKKNNKIVSIITIIKKENFKVLSDEIFFFLILNPKILIFNFFYLINNFKNKIISNFDNNHLYLLHLIIFKKYFFKMKLSNKDLFFNWLFIKILKENNANKLFLHYEKNNLAAHRFYLRNKFKIYDTKSNIIYAKKKFY